MTITNQVMPGRLLQSKTLVIMCKKIPNQTPKMLREGLLTLLRLKDLMQFVSNTKQNALQCNSQSCRR